MKEAEKLAAAGIIKHKIDVSYLYLDEFRQVVNIKQADLSLIEQRKAKYAHYQKLLPRALSCLTVRFLPRIRS